MMIGDLSLLSPELKMGKPASPSSDLYAYGCLLLWVCYFFIETDKSFIYIYFSIESDGLKWFSSVYYSE